MQRVLVSSGLTQFLPLSFTNVNSLFSLQQRLHRPLQQRSLAAASGRTNFSTSPLFYKKKDKSKSSSTSSLEERLFKSGVVSEDPYDFTQLHDGIADAVSRLKDDLSKLRVGGRLNTEAIEALRVQLSKSSKSSKSSKETVKLGELAQVVPKGGRMVTVLASEEDHIKPIISAIVSSGLSLSPQPDAHNALQLNIPIPPPTKEFRDQTVSAAKSAMEKATAAVRDARGSVHKRLQDMQKKKIARPDDVRKAQEQMEKLTEKGQREVRDLFDTAKKAMERA
ncbi:ribosome recycling factor domain-containing protein [Aspergillus alliaceus]|uniref:Ribosome recycling factor domain-containing protein n=1 Tax=Petromyces alliaceus TaxID=209559 RepID=A0A5N7C961_PETAA|nr:ribosome recycling factor domain-containing protein [Aspergillus alliaceus]